MLTLLLAPEAYTVIGLVFAIFLVAALGVILANRFRIVVNAAQMVTDPEIRR